MARFVSIHFNRLKSSELILKRYVIYIVNKRVMGYVAWCCVDFNAEGAEKKYGEQGGECRDTRFRGRRQIFCFAQDFASFSDGQIAKELFGKRSRCSGRLT